MGLLTAVTIKKFEFHKSKMADVPLYLSQRYEKQCKMYKIGSFRAVRGHSRSSAISSFDRTHTSIQRVVCQKLHLHLLPHSGVTPVEFRDDLLCQKLGSLR